MSNQQIIQSNAMPEQVLTTMPPGSKGPMDAGVKMQQQQTASQMALIGGRKIRGSRRNCMSKYMSKFMRGGATPVVQVPPVSAGAVNPQATQSNYTDLTQLAQMQSSQAAFDNAKTPEQTAGIAAQQQALYSGKTGGSSKRGGSWPVWGCLSGGKKSRKCRSRGRKCRKSKSRKNRKTKRRNH
jgi:hypothetical protein